MPDADAGNRYALETRAEVLKMVSAQVAVRRGELDRLEIGSRASSDAVAGVEALHVRGDLHESTHSHQVQAERLQTRVDGKLTARIHSDTTLLGGAMAETHAGAVLVTAGMSDDLVAGGGLRATALADLWLAGLVGLEEKVGTAIVDGALLEAFGTHFEREYGTGNHVAGFASFSGTVHTTTATGFRPLFKVASGVRNLTPGGAAGAAADAPPGTTPPLQTVVPPAAPDTPPANGLLADSADIARVTDGVDDLASPTANVEQIDYVDLNRRISRLQVGGDAPARSADTAEELTQARYLTTAEIDDTLVRLRARAELPDETTIEGLYDFVRRIDSGRVGDDTFVRAAGRANQEIDQALEPFRYLAGDAVVGDDFWDLRNVFVADLEDARAAGDLERAAELQGGLLGFDAIVYQHTMELLDRFPDLAEGDEFLGGLSYVPMPPSASTGTQYARQPLAQGFDLGDAAEQLEDLRSEWLDDLGPDIVVAEDKFDDAIELRNQELRARADLVGLALDELARGNDPLPALQAQVEQARSRQAADTARFAGEYDAIEDGAELIGMIVNDATSRANRGQDTLALQRTFNARRMEVRGAADWGALRRLTQASNELFEASETYRPLLESALGADEVERLVDFREPASVRNALVRARDTMFGVEDLAAAAPSTRRQDAIQLRTAIVDYDALVQRLLGEALLDAEIVRGRSVPLPLEVNQAAVAGELRRVRQQMLDEVRAFTPATEADLLREAELVVHAQDYMNSYGYAAKLVQQGTDPTPYLDAEIEYLHYVFSTGGQDPSVDDAAHTARVLRLQDARDRIRQIILAETTLDAPSVLGDMRWLEDLTASAGSTDQIGASSTWQLAGADALGDDTAAAVRFEGAADGRLDQMKSLRALNQRYGGGESGEEIGEGTGDESRPASAVADAPAAQNAFTADNGYPLLPARLPSDVDAATFEAAIGDARDAFLDPIASAASTDEVARIKRGAFARASDAVAAGEDPVPVLDGLIAAAHMRASQAAPHHQDEAAILADARAALAGILAELRGPEMPIDRYEQVAAADRIDDLRQRTGAALGDMPAEPVTAPDFVHPPSALRGKVRKDLSVQAHPPQQVRRYVDVEIINVFDPDADSPDNVYAVLTGRNC